MDRFKYMVVGDDRQRYMPLPEDRLPGRGQPLATPEAVLLIDPVEPEFKGEVLSLSLSQSCNEVLQLSGLVVL